MIGNMRFTTILPLAFFASVGVTFGLGLMHDPKVIPSMLIDKPLPSFKLQPLLDNQPPLASDSFPGHGVTLINVFSSWCGSCRLEHPLLMTLTNDKRFRLVGLNWKDRPDDARQFLGNYGNPFAQIGSDESGRVGINLGVSGVPETFVIDAEGRVRLRVPGPLTPEVWKTEIEPLLAPENKRS